MSKITESGMSQSESLIMDYLWKEGTGKTFAQIMAFLGNKAGKEWAKQTVNTFLRRLIDKGVVRTESIGRKKVYFAAQTVAEYEKQRSCLTICMKGLSWYFCRHSLEESKLMRRWLIICAH